jgi:hypothetical protein
MVASRQGDLRARRVVPEGNNPNQVTVSKGTEISLPVCTLDDIGPLAKLLSLRLRRHLRRCPIAHKGEQRDVEKNAPDLPA